MGGPHLAGRVKLVLWTRQDPASERVAGALLTAGRFKAPGPAPGTALDTPTKSMLMEVDGSLLAADYIERRAAAAAREPVTRALFLSKHSAESGKRSFTVHPLGNLGPEARFGGQPRRVVPPDPQAATALLRALTDVAPSAGSTATLEATHHGPVLEVPSAFVEVGSTLEDWRNETLCNAVAGAVERAWLPLPDAAPAGESAAGVGGGHYHPKQTDYARRTGTGVGHLIPDYAVGDLDDDTLEAALSQSRARRVLVDGRSLSARQRLRVKQVAARAGASVEDLAP